MAMAITAEQMFADVELMLRKAAEDNELEYEQFIARIELALENAERMAGWRRLEDFEASNSSNTA